MNTILLIILILAIIVVIALILIQKKLRRRFELDVLYMSRYEGLDLSEMPYQSNRMRTYKPTIEAVRDKQKKVDNHNKYLAYLTGLKEQYQAKQQRKNKKKVEENLNYSLFDENDLDNSSYDDHKNNHFTDSFDDVDLYIKASEQKERFLSLPDSTNTLKNFNQENIHHREIGLDDSIQESILKTPKEDYEVITINEVETFKSSRTPLKEKKQINSHVKKNQLPKNNDSSEVVIPHNISRKSITDAIEDYYVKNDENTNFSIDYDPKKKSKLQTSAPTDIISTDEIKNNLLRLRNIRRRDNSTSNNVITPTIQAEEVFQNLKGSDSPLTRSKKEPEAPLRTIIPESIIPEEAKIKGKHGYEVKYNHQPQTPISTKFTPSDNSASTESSTESSMLSATANAASTVSSYGRKRQTYLQSETLGDKEPEEYNRDSNEEYDDNSDDNSTQTPNLSEQYFSHSNSISQESYQAPLDGKNNNIRLNENRVESRTVSTPTITGNSVDGHYQPPNLSLLEPKDISNTHQESKEKIIARGQLIENKLAEFKVKVSVTDAYAGPVVTRYDIEPDTGVRGNQVINLEKDLARALGCTSIRIVDTIPGKTCMGLELPNSKRKVIRLSEIFDTDVFLQSKSKLTLALGQDITGAPIVTDLTKSPHLLVAGTTGSGKSVGINAMILSMLFKATPDEVRLIMIDPKMLELSIYEGIPHLLAPVVTDMKLAPNALIWCVNEMEKRYKIMSQLGVRNIVGYNQKVKMAQQNGQPIANPFSLTPDNPELLKPFPYIVVVVDEFADLMMTTGKKIEELIARLAQKARAAGIHLILATQRPSVDVITGLIKANIPSRIAFQVSSKVDSRTIIDQMGAENLLGMGDMLFTRGSGYPTRVHGAFVADEEVHRVVEYLKQFGEPEYVEDILTAGVGEDDLFSNSNSQRSNDAEDDPMYDEAVNVVLTNQKASISFVQRNLRIGYNRAARLIEQMEASGIVSPPENNGSRTILVNNTPSD
ncbi:cell division protein FtsK [Neisseriaceae bacterium PsAf]|nr:cell division protein FtsK [Neisseriaceae bacterium PsAf]